jgi:hypothetical protein
MNIVRHIFNPLFEVNKHMELVNLIAILLQNDGKGDAYRLLNSTDEVTGKTGLELLAEGTKNADLPFSGAYILHLLHFHHPWSHRGYLIKHSSADETARLFAAAKNIWQNGAKGEAIYQLGRAVHLIQDINIPHHAAVTAISGHGDFEKWLTDNGNDYLVQSGGYYSWEEEFCDQDGQTHYVNSANPYDWIDYGSHLSFPSFKQYFSDCNHTEEMFPQVAALVMPHVLRLSAGFISKFFSEVDF